MLFMSSRLLINSYSDILIQISFLYKYYIIVYIMPSFAKIIIAILNRPFYLIKFSNFVLLCDYNIIIHVFPNIIRKI